MIPKPVEPAELKKRARSLIDDQSTMTLATAKGQQAWAAPVYYAFHRSAFYFFSSPNSRHIEEALESEQASAAIYPTVTAWEEIKGIQMSGRIVPCNDNLRALVAYTIKFPFVKSFFKPGQSLTPGDFVQRFHTSFYCFVPELVYYLDNRISFGFREAVSL